MTIYSMREFLKITKALSDKTRVRIFKMLQHKEMCVCEVQAILGMAQSTVSKHLQILEDAGLATSIKEGLWVNHKIAKHSHNIYAEPIVRYLTGILDNDPQVVADREKAYTTNRLEICRKKDHGS
jgi:ArsR family transcriptional regulator